MKAVLLNLILCVTILSQYIFAFPSFVSDSTLQILSPNGGEIFEAGSSHEIRWTSSGIGNIKIEYTIDSSMSWNTIISNVSASTGSYYWLVPNTVRQFCKIRLSDIQVQTVYDESDYFFTIVNFEEAEPNNSWETAEVILLNESVHGSLSPVGDIDYYKFTASERDTLVIAMSGDNNSKPSGYIMLYNATNNIQDLSYLQSGKPVELPFVFTVSGTYFIRFAHNPAKIPNKSNTALPVMENEKRFMKSHQENSVQDQTGDYIISLKRFAPGNPDISQTYSFNTYFNSSQVGALVNAHGLITKVTFEYGTSTGYGNTTEPVYFNSISFSDVGSELSGLSPNTTYHVRVKAENDFGEVYSTDFALLTPEGPESWIIKSIDTNNEGRFPYNTVLDFSFPTKNIGFAIKEGPGILKTTDAGNTWRTYADDYYLNKVFSIDSNNVICMSGTKILKTTNSGATWEMFYTDVNVPLYSMFFTDFNNGYVVGSSGTILKTTDGGINWIAQYSNTSRVLNDVFFY